MHTVVAVAVVTAAAAGRLENNEALYDGTIGLCVSVFPFFLHTFLELMTNSINKKNNYNNNANMVSCKFVAYVPFSLKKTFLIRFIIVCCVCI